MYEDKGESIWRLEEILGDMVDVEEMIYNIFIYVLCNLIIKYDGMFIRWFIVIFFL